MSVESEQHAFQRRYFDAEFAHYERYELPNWRLSFIERIFASLRVLDGGGPYLDVGVGGSGATVIEAARRGVRATGSDLSTEGIDVARRFAASEGVLDRTTFVVAPAESLPFADNAFGSVSGVAVLEHLDDDGRAAREMARVLRPGGLAWVTVPHAFRYMPPPVWPLYWVHDRRIGHKRHYTEASLVRLFRAAGLNHVRTSFSAHPVKLVQFLGERLVPSLGRPRSAWWWRLEGRDRDLESRPWGALQLSAVFRKEADSLG